MTATPVVAIVGRTNVGKSTLFNRLIERKKAIVSAVPGTTVDINFGHCHWRGRTVTVIDTAGLDLTAATATDAGIKKQAEMAMTKADVILLVVDLTAGLNPQDRAFAKYLQKSKKNVIFVANKADGPAKRREASQPEWLKLGYGAPLPVSAVNGSGVGDMLDVLEEVLAAHPPMRVYAPEPDVRVAIIGRPNVGKSSLLNAMAGEPRVIVSEVPHTTKEPQDTLLTFDEKGVTRNILLVDTVGIRKKAKVAPGIERTGVHMSLEELKRADVVFLIVDAQAGVELQEKKLAGLVSEYNVGILIVVNKWDLVEGRKANSADEYREYVKAHLAFFPWAAVAFISAKSGHNVGKLLAQAVRVANERSRVIPQEELDEFIVKVKKKHHALFAEGGDRFGKKGKRPKVFGMSQIGTKPPSFMLVVRDKDTLSAGFLSFVENRMREEFGFEGTPVKVSGREIGKMNV